MKNAIYSGLVLLLLASCGGADKTEGGNVEFKNDNDKLSYAIGLDAGGEIFKTIKSQNMDTMINRELLVQGLTDAIMENEASMNPDSAKMIIRNYFMGAQEKRMKEELKNYEPNKQEGENFLAQNKTKEGVTTTESGLQYEVLKKGNGPKPALNDSAEVHYKGYFLNGEVFDSSIERNQTFWFGVSYGTVIDGWVEAVQLMNVGSKYKIYLPYQLAYGDRMIPGIKPYSMLIFEVELISMKKTAANK